MQLALPYLDSVTKMDEMPSFLNLLSSRHELYMVFWQLPSCHTWITRVLLFGFPVFVQNVGLSSHCVTLPEQQACQSTRAASAVGRLAAAPSVTPATARGRAASGQGTKSETATGGRKGRLSPAWPHAATPSGGHARRLSDVKGRAPVGRLVVVQLFWQRGLNAIFYIVSQPSSFIW